MATTLFEEILGQLAPALDLPNLHPDTHNATRILWKKSVSIQLQFDQKDRFFLMVASLGALPPDRFREDFFKAALAYNARYSLRYPLFTFAYSTKAQVLTLSASFERETLKPEQLPSTFLLLADTAYAWKEALHKGIISPEL